MARQAQPASTSPPGGLPEVPAQPTAEDAVLLEQVKALVAEDKAQKAVDLIIASRSSAPWLTNALGVCLLRLGNAPRAVEVLRSLAVAGTHLALRSDVPAVFKTNFATALLLADNLAGCHDVLRELKDDQHPAVHKLREAFAKWQQSLSLWQKLQWWTGGHPSKHPTLDFPPGDL
jgi:hypothetical protein